MGNLIYGCDICQQCCPWMRFVHRPEGEGQGEQLAAWQATSPLWGSPPEEVTVPRLLELMALDDAGFQERFRHSPIRRIKRARLLRNVAVALGNAGEPIALPILEQATRDTEPLIREHAAWAIRQIQQKQDARQD
jgi:epoxyqueuosine reductase